MKNRKINFVVIVFLAATLLFGVNNRVYAETQINEIALAGGALPIVGEHPNYSWCEEPAAKYTLTSTPKWIDGSTYDMLTASNTFEAGKTYYLEATFKPNTGYCFPSAEYALTVTLRNFDPSKYEVFSINKAGGGTYPNRTIRYKFVTPEATTYTVSFDPNGGSGTMQNDIVEKESSYVLPNCTFTAPSSDLEFSHWKYDGSYTIKPGKSLTINHNITFYAVWKDSTQGKTEIREVSLTSGVLPKVGENPSFSWIVPNNCHYSLTSSVYWLDKSTYNRLTASDAFENGKNYLLCATFKPDEGYYFSDAEDLTATLRNIDSYKYSINRINPAGGGTYPNRQVMYEFHVTNEQIKYTVTTDFNGGTNNGFPEVQYVNPGVIITFSSVVMNNLKNQVIPPNGKELDALEINGVRYNTGDKYSVNSNTIIKLLWKNITSADILKGDMNKDNYVNSTDAALVLDRFKNNDATEEDFARGNMNGDNVLNSTDAAMILDVFKNS